MRDNRRCDIKPIDRGKLEGGGETLVADLGSVGTMPVLDSAATAAWAEAHVVTEAPDPLGVHSSSPVDAAGLVALADGDFNFARGLVRSYADTAQDALATIATAFAVGESLTLGEVAHVMKGASANLFALAATAAAEQLEDAAKSGEERLKTADPQGLHGELHMNCDRRYGLEQACQRRSIAGPPNS